MPSLKALKEMAQLKKIVDPIFEKLDDRRPLEAATLRKSDVVSQEEHMAFRRIAERVTDDSVSLGLFKKHLSKALVVSLYLKEYGLAHKILNLAPEKVDLNLTLKSGENALLLAVDAPPTGTAKRSILNIMIEKGAEVTADFVDRALFYDVSHNGRNGMYTDYLLDKMDELGLRFDPSLNKGRETALDMVLDKDPHNYELILSLIDKGATADPRNLRAGMIAANHPVLGSYEVLAKLERIYKDVKESKSRTTDEPKLESTSVDRDVFAGAAAGGGGRRGGEGEVAEPSFTAPLASEVTVSDVVRDPLKKELAASATQEKGHSK